MLRPFDLRIMLGAFAAVLACIVSISAQKESGLVHYGDLIDVDVVGSFEFDWRGGVTPEGMLDGFNSYGDPINALCRTESEIAGEIKERLSKILRDPKVNVRILDRSKRPVAILDGAVRKPQKFLLNRDATLLELIVMAGGLTDDASGEIQLFRPPALNCEAKDGSAKRAEQFTAISVADIIAGVAAANPIVHSGDIITVRRADEIYVIGGVVEPRIVSSRTQTTLTAAVAAAGGLAKGAGESVTIYRRTAGVTTMIEADLKKIAAGLQEDPKLSPFDIVDVRSKGSEARKTPPLLLGRPEAKVVTLPLRIVD